MYTSVYVIFEHSLRLYYLLKGGERLYIKKRCKIITFVVVMILIQFFSIVMEIIFDCSIDMYSLDKDAVFLAMEIKS